MSEARLNDQVGQINREQIATRLPQVIATPASDQKDIDLRRLTAKHLEQQQTARKQVEKLKNEQGPVDTI